MVHSKGTGTIQIDLDGLWANLQYYGHKIELIPDIIFESSIPRYLELFDKYNVKATFFLIGKDGEIREKVKLVREISKAGHEVANHTYSHIFGFRKLSSSEKIKEIERGEKVIEKVTGKLPVGFKVPGYDIDVETLKLLTDKNYLYDSSIISTPIYPLIMEMNRFLSGGIRRTHGPKISWFFAPNKIYHPSYKKEWQRGNLAIHELPCSVMPFFRLPYHATFATKLGLNYFHFAYNLAKLNNNPINYEFHALDLSDDVKDKRLSSLTSIKFEKRYNVCKQIIKKFSKDNNIIPSKELIEFKRIN